MDRPVGIYASSLSRRGSTVRRWRRRRIAIAARATALATVLAGSAAAVAVAQRLAG